MPTPGITHRYPDRVLFYTTHNCPVYCRHCTRKRKVADPTSAAAKKQIEDSLAYIEKHAEIRDAPDAVTLALIGIALATIATGQPSSIAKAVIVQ